MGCTSIGELATSTSALTGTVLLLGMARGSALGGLLVNTFGVATAFTVNAASFTVDGAMLVVAAAPTVPFAFAGSVAVGSVCIASVLATLQTAEPAMTGLVMAIFATTTLGGTALGGPVASALTSMVGARAPFVLGAFAAAGTAVLTFFAARAASRVPQ